MAAPSQPGAPLCSTCLPATLHARSKGMRGGVFMHECVLCALPQIRELEEEVTKLRSANERLTAEARDAQAALAHAQSQARAARTQDAGASAATTGPYVSKLEGMLEVGRKAEPHTAQHSSCPVLAATYTCALAPQHTRPWPHPAPSSGGDRTCSAAGGGGAGCRAAGTGSGRPSTRCGGRGAGRAYGRGAQRARGCPP